jgi:hypothetical protein
MMATKLAVLAVILFLVGAGAGVRTLFLRHDTASGDPHGDIMRQLKDAALVVPDGAHIIHRNDIEPYQDSCDGLPQTHGWSDVRIEIAFSTSLLAGQLISHGDGQLAARGWSRDEAIPMWSKRLSEGTEATATLTPDPELGPSSWTLEASAPPVGRRVIGC